MPKIRIREFIVDGVRQPAKGAISLGSKMLQEPKTVKGRDARGQEFEQHVPGVATCLWLVPKGTADASNKVDVADVDEDIARVLVDERGWCERIAGRPAKRDVIGAEVA